MWRLGQMKAGDTMQYHEVSLEYALNQRKKVDDFLNAIAGACNSGQNSSAIKPLDYTSIAQDATLTNPENAIVHRVEASDTQPQTLYRQVSMQRLNPTASCGLPELTVTGRR